MLSLWTALQAEGTPPTTSTEQSKPDAVQGARTDAIAATPMDTGTQDGPTAASSPPRACLAFPPSPQSVSASFGHEFDESSDRDGGDVSNAREQHPATSTRRLTQLAPQEPTESMQAGFLSGRTPNMQGPRSAGSARRASTGPLASPRPGPAHAALLAWAAETQLYAPL